MMLRRATVSTVKVSKFNKLPISSCLFTTRCYQSNQNQGGYKPPTNQTQQSTGYQSQPPTQQGEQQQTSLFNFEVPKYSFMRVSISLIKFIPVRRRCCSERRTIPRNTNYSH